MGASDLWMLVGLGNPTPRHQGNRHNVGFMVLDALAGSAELDWRSSSRFAAEVAKGMLDGQPVVLVKPQTYMNLSGRAAAGVAHFYEVPVDRILAIHDDVDLEPGRLRIKSGGGDGGHKGIRSLAQELGSPGFIRVRFGIGRPEFGEVEDYVLRDFGGPERELVEEAIRRAVDAVETVLHQGLREAMNRHNGPLETDAKDAKEAKEVSNGRRREPAATKEQQEGEKR
jgi:PTH1 family peptidyl-tRNA hydrolase